MSGNVSFRVDVRWPENDLALESQWAGVRVPPGLTFNHVRVPNFVNGAKMLDLAGPSKRALYASGLVAPVLTAALSDPRQLVTLRTPGALPRTHGPLQFQFQGGEVVLTLQLSMYM